MLFVKATGECAGESPVGSPVVRHNSWVVQRWTASRGTVWSLVMLGMQGSGAEKSAGFGPGMGGCRHPSAALVIYFQAEPPVLGSFCRRVSRVPAVAKSSGVSRHVGASRTPSRECDDVDAVALGGVNTQRRVTRQAVRAVERKRGGEAAAGTTATAEPSRGGDTAPTDGRGSG